LRARSAFAGKGREKTNCGKFFSCGKPEIGKLKK
jgi:hypothetical protein